MVGERFRKIFGAFVSTRAKAHADSVSSWPGAYRL